jgi:SPP1 family predicted phage head-tail adaptor
MDTIGEMRERVNFMNPITSRDSDTGEQLSSWVESSSIWSAVEEHRAGSDEKEQQGRKTAIDKVTFTMYFNSSVKPTWRVKYGSKQYEIKAIQPDHDQMFMNIKAENTEPWRNEYWLSPSDGFWTDWDGNYWVVVDRGGEKPTFGNLTWTDSLGNSWTTT